MRYINSTLFLLLLMFLNMDYGNAITTPVVALGGLVTGIIGTVLSTLGVGVQVGVVLAGKVAEREKMKMNETMSTEAPMETRPYYRGQMAEERMMMSPNRYVRRVYDDRTYSAPVRRFRMIFGRKKRSTDDTYEQALDAKVLVENFTDKLYRNDHSQCVEKIICNIYRKAYNEDSITPVESSLLQLVETNMNHGLTYKKMLVAQKMGSFGEDCDYLFSSCPLLSSQMVKFIEYSAKKIPSSL